MLKQYKNKFDMRYRYIQDPKTFELVPAEDYAAPVTEHFHNVMPDIKPYKSMIDGSLINSRSKHRVHLRDHDCIEVGNEKMERKRPKLPSAKEDVIRAAHQAGLLGDYHAHR
jgi:hypothetical protein